MVVFTEGHSGKKKPKSQHLNVYATMKFILFLALKR